MAFHIRDPQTDRVVRELAAARGVTLTEAVRSACDEALRNVARPLSKDERHARMRAVREKLAQLPRNENVVIDKAFFDALNDE
jgi:antitoxin VapB